MYEESVEIEWTASAADDNFKWINLIYLRIRSYLNFSQPNSIALSMRHDDDDNDDEEKKARKSLLQIYFTEPNKSSLISQFQMHESNAINITTSNEMNQRAKKKNASTKFINTTWCLLNEQEEMGKHCQCKLIKNDMYDSIIEHNLIWFVTLKRFFDRSFVWNRSDAKLMVERTFCFSFRFF